ncbi:Nem1-Spo7 phosphatase regulatory subunit [Rhizina undulata]
MTPDTSTDSLDLAVKGSLPSSSSTTPRPPPLPPSNPLDSAPSSPSQIYLNLLLLEASLRSQYLHLLSRRRKFTFFLVLLFLWNLFFFLRIFLFGGSPYSSISVLEKLGLGGGVVTAGLYYATGLYHTTIVEPRRFVSSSNRGLRGFNVKLVKIPLSYRGWITWWWGWYTFSPPAPPPPPKRRPSNTKRPTHLHPHSPSTPSKLSQPINPGAEDSDSTDDEVEEWLPGGLHLKLIVLPKGFSPDFREGWELYRSEYWEKENEARAVLRASIARTSRLRIGWGLFGGFKKAGSFPSPLSRGSTPEPEAVITGRRLSVARRRSVRAGSTGGDVSDSGSTSTFEGRVTRSSGRGSQGTIPVVTVTEDRAAKKKGGGGRGRGKKRSGTLRKEKDKD